MKTKWLIGLFVLGALALMFVGLSLRLGKEQASGEKTTAIHIEGAKISSKDLKVSF